MQYLNIEPLELDKPQRINGNELENFKNKVISCVLYATVNNGNVFTINLQTYQSPFMGLESNQTVLTLPASFGTKSETKLAWCHPINANIKDLRNKLVKLCSCDLEEIGYVLIIIFLLVN